MLKEIINGNVFYSNKDDQFEDIIYDVEILFL